MRLEVELETHQRAVVVVDVPSGAKRDEVVEAALRKLDESGGAEWESLYTEEQWRELPE